MKSKIEEENILEPNDLLENERSEENDIDQELTIWDNVPIYGEKAEPHLEKSNSQVVQFVEDQLKNAVLGTQSGFKKMKTNNSL